MTYEKKEPVTKICALASCSEIFETARERKRFHSDECRKEFMRLVSVNECPHCGRELIPNV